MSLLSLSLPLFIVTYVYSNHASALTYNNSIDLEYTFNPSLDVSFNTNTGFIIEDLAPGNASYSNTVVITASSNNSDGYNLLASVGDSNDVNRNNNRLVNTNNVNYFESVAADADLELSALGENKWGYAIYNSDTSAWSNYNGLPAVSADRSSDLTLVSTDTAGDTEVLMRIGASATNTQVAGEFTNKINFFVTTNVVTYDYSITYNANDGSDGSSVSNMPNNVSGSLQTGQELLTSNDTPVRNNYEFLGWCDETSTDAGCSGNIYSANDFIKLNSPINNTNGNVNNVTLSAIWGAKYMQDITLAECRNRATDQPVTAYDRRDENDYAIRYIADACWMTQNLRITHSIGQQEWIISKEYSNFDNVDTWNIHMDDLASHSGANSGDYTRAASHVASEENITVIRESVGLTTLASELITTKNVGVWYSLCAVTANNSFGCSNEGDYIPNLGDTTGDICPFGWHLPTSSSNKPGDFLSVTGQSAISMFSPVYSGRYANGVNVLYVDGALFSNYWSATKGSHSYRQRTGIYRNDVDGGLSHGESNKRDGNTVRCARTS